MRVHGLGYRDGLEMSLLLDCEIIPAAARCRDEALRRAMSALLIHVEACDRSEEHTSELQSLMRISYAVFCLKKKKKTTKTRRASISIEQKRSQDIKRHKDTIHNFKA